jgi:hypothetical protein
MPIAGALLASIANKTETIAVPVGANELASLEDRDELAITALPMNCFHSCRDDAPVKIRDHF